MSRSQIACAFDTGSTTVARVKSTSTGSFTMTMCRTIDGGLDALGGPKGMRLAKKLVSMLREWREEPVALSFSPAEIRTLPAWFPEQIASGSCDELCRIEAGYFLNNLESWRWHDMKLEPAAEQDNKLTRRMLLFYPSAPACFIERELQQHHDVRTSGVHLEPLARLSVGTGEPLAVLELEARYAALSISIDGKIDYFRYWAVKDASERDYFAVTELTSAPIGDTPVMVTGSAASPKTIERIGRETPRTLEPLEIHKWVSAEKGAVKSKSPTATIRAASTAIMALNNSTG
ncbi:MAG TPA: hypothetical protein ENL07_05600 [Chlorobaculum parvum]|uniref:Uncharacterized protein n=1 Tax=Chlorobaculum parvum TaxID=274539 RepID=A0A7C5HJD2_9CHLB|nr:hypothetical protein [Chlorobaculum parvum]